MTRTLPTASTALDHIGITVPDIEAATKFLVEALGAVVIRDLLVVDPSRDGTANFEPDDLFDALGVPHGVYARGIRLLSLGSGSIIELFEFAADEQHEAVRASDFGLQHLGVVTADIEASTRRIVAAGGTLLRGPIPLPGTPAGSGNLFHYTRAPWGTVIELLQFGDAGDFADTPVEPQ